MLVSQLGRVDKGWDIHVPHEQATIWLRQEAAVGLVWFQRVGAGRERFVRVGMGLG